jgi:chromatin segregation and condensation protein Rec8/ScpA/Scc1 (kleisin family)
VAELMSMAEGTRATSFRVLVAGCRTRMDVIVHFLALLELCKMGRVALGQGETFGDLQIAWIAVEDQLAAVGASGRGLAELGGYDVEEYEG